MPRYIDKEHPEQNPRNIPQFRNRIKALEEQKEEHYKALQSCKENKEWFEIVRAINNLSVDLDNIKKQYAFRNTKSDFVPDQYVIIN